MDTYTVEFRMEGLELQPFEITETLGLVPCQTIEANKHINKRNLNALWAYDGVYFEDNSPSYEWKNLEEGLLFVLGKLEEKLQLIESDFFMYKRYFWCASFQESFDGGVSLSPDLLKKLADFNSELIISNYHGEDIKTKGIDL